MYADLATYAGTAAGALALAVVSPVLALLYRAKRDLRNARRALYADELTGLANCRAYRAYVDTALRTRQPIAIVLIDLDEFKSVNDRFGHHVGDQVLCQVGMRLHRLSHAIGLSARLSGDEFVLVIDDDAAAETVAMRAWEAISAAPFAVGSEPLRLTASIGVAKVADSGYDRVLRVADRAMYRAKASGGGVMYAPMESRSLVRQHG